MSTQASLKKRMAWYRAQISGPMGIIPNLAAKLFVGGLNSRLQCCDMELRTCYYVSTRAIAKAFAGIPLQLEQPVVLPGVDASLAAYYRHETFGHVRLLYGQEITFARNNLEDMSWTGIKSVHVRQIRFEEQKGEIVPKGFKYADELCEMVFSDEATVIITPMLVGFMAAVTEAIKKGI